MLAEPTEVAANAGAIHVKSLSLMTEAATRRVVDSILRTPEISARISHDHRRAGYIAHPDVSYLGAYVRGEMVGVFTVVESGFVEVDLHAAILRRALPHARQLGRACMAHVFADATIARATAYVIEGLESAANYCMRLGFRREGFRRDACLKAGRLVGVHVLGMTRADWEISR